VEPLLGLAILSALGYGAYRLGRCAVTSLASLPARRRQERERRATDTRRREQERAHRQAHATRLAALQRRLAQALAQVTQAPDFQRAANWAAHARELPAGVRQRIFRQFRGALLRHFAARLAAGTDANALLESLRTLLSHLGIPAFEADYLKAEAERLRTAPPPATHPNYEQRLRDLQRDHEQRMGLLRTIAALDPETREQLLEAEERRFREELLALGGGETNSG